MAGNVEDFTPGGVFQGSNINFAAATSSSSDATEVFIEQFAFNNSTRILSSTFNTGGAGPTVHIPAIGVDSDAVDTYVTEGSFNASDFIVTFTYNNGLQFNLDLSAIMDDINNLPNTDTNNYLDGISKADNVYTFEVSGQTSQTLDLTEYDEYEPGSSDVSIDDGNGNTVTFQSGGRIVVGTTPVPTPAFAPELPAAPAAQDFSTEQTYEFDAPVNDDADFVIDDVTVTATDQDDNNLGNVTVNDDNSYEIVVPAGTEEVDVEVVITDTEGDSVTLTEMINPYKPYWQGTTATNGTISIGNYATALTKVEEDFPIGDSFNIVPHGSNTTGRVRYWVVAPFNMTFTSGGLPFSPDGDAATFTLAGETYYIYDMGIAGNPFDSSAAAPTQTFVSTEV